MIPATATMRAQGDGDIGGNIFSGNSAKQGSSIYRDSCLGSVLTNDGLPTSAVTEVRPAAGSCAQAAGVQVAGHLARAAPGCCCWRVQWGWRCHGWSPECAIPHLAAALEGKDCPAEQQLCLAGQRRWQHGDTVQLHHPGHPLAVGAVKQSGPSGAAGLPSQPLPWVPVLKLQPQPPHAYGAAQVCAAPVWRRVAPQH